MTESDATGTLTCLHVARQGKDVFSVFHEVDGSWQHLCSEKHGSLGATDFVIVGIAHLESRQPGLLELRDLPLGWAAHRTRSGGWRRLAIPPP